MSETKFTKGEWVINERHGEISIEANQDDDGFYDLICEGIDGELNANAHLIAAAPKMYAMLEELSGYDENQMHRQEIDKLLAEARGEL